MDKDDAAASKWAATLKTLREADLPLTDEELDCTICSYPYDNANHIPMKVDSCYALPPIERNDGVTVHHLDENRGIAPGCRHGAVCCERCALVLLAKRETKSCPLDRNWIKDFTPDLELLQRIVSADDGRYLTLVRQHNEALDALQPVQTKLDQLMRLHDHTCKGSASLMIECKHLNAMLVEKSAERKQAEKEFKAQRTRLEGVEARLRDMTHARDRTREDAVYARSELEQAEETLTRLLLAQGQPTCISCFREGSLCGFCDQHWCDDHSDDSFCRHGCIKNRETHMVMVYGDLMGPYPPYVEHFGCCAGGSRQGYEKACKRRLRRSLRKDQRWPTFTERFVHAYATFLADKDILPLSSMMIEQLRSMDHVNSALLRHGRREGYDHYMREFWYHLLEKDGIKSLADRGGSMGRSVLDRSLLSRREAKKEVVRASTEALHQWTAAHPHVTDDDGEDEVNSSKDTPVNAFPGEQRAQAAEPEGVDASPVPPRIAPLLRRDEEIFTTLAPANAPYYRNYYEPGGRHHVAVQQKSSFIRRGLSAHAEGSVAQEGPFDAFLGPPVSSSSFARTVPYEKYDRAADDRPDVAVPAGMRTAHHAADVVARLEAYYAGLMGDSNGFAGLIPPVLNYEPTQIEMRRRPDPHPVIVDEAAHIDPEVLRRHGLPVLEVSDGARALLEADIDAYLHADMPSSGGADVVSVAEAAHIPTELPYAPLPPMNLGGRFHAYTDSGIMSDYYDAPSHSDDANE